MAVLSQEVQQAIMNAEDTPSFEPIPAGEYMLRCEKSEQRPTRDGTGQIIMCAFEVLGPAYPGRRVFHNFNISNKNHKAMVIGCQQLKSFIKSCGLDSVSDTDQLIGLTVSANVKIDPPSNGYEARNSIKTFKPCAGAAAHPAQAAPAPLPGAPAAGGDAAPAVGPDSEWFFR